MLALYSRIEKVLYKGEKVIVTLMMMIMFVSVFVQVVSRYFNLPIPDTSDISLVSFAIMTFIGSGLLVYTKGHILIEISSLIKSKKTVLTFEILSYISMLIIIGVLLNIGLSLLFFTIQSGETTMALRIPMAIPYAALVIGLLLMLVHTIGNFMDQFISKKNREDE